MNVVEMAKRAFAAVAEYERLFDYDATAYLMDRVRLLEQEIAELKHANNERAALPPTSAPDFTRVT